MAPTKPRAPRTKPEEVPVEEQNEETKGAKSSEGHDINELMHLPLCLVWHELVKRGFHPGMVRKWDQPYCVFLLRECEARIKGASRSSAGVSLAKGRQQKKPFYETQEALDEALEEATKWDEEFQKNNPPPESDQ